MRFIQRPIVILLQKSFKMVIVSRSQNQARLLGNLTMTRPILGDALRHRLRGDVPRLLGNQLWHCQGGGVYHGIASSATHCSIA